MSPTPGAAIEEGLRAGRPRRITVTFLGAAPQAARRVVAIAEGDGLAALLRGAGALVVRYDSGDRPTPPALISAIRQAGEQVIVVPNGPQVAAVAAAAAARLGDEGIEVSVIPVSSAVQGLAAVAVHDPLRAFGADVAAMTPPRPRCGTAGWLRPGPAGCWVCRGGAGRDRRPAGRGGRRAGRAACRGRRRARHPGRGRGRAARAGLAELVASRLREASPGIETVCYGGGPARLPLLIGVECRHGEPAGSARPVVGAKAAKRLAAALGVATVGELLRHYPRRYENRGELTDLASLRDGENVTVQAEIASFRAQDAEQARHGAWRRWSPTAGAGWRSPSSAGGGRTGGSRRSSPARAACSPARSPPSRASASSRIPSTSCSAAARRCPGRRVRGRADPGLPGHQGDHLLEDRRHDPDRAGPAGRDGDPLPALSATASPLRLR